MDNGKLFILRVWKLLESCLPIPDDAKAHQHSRDYSVPPKVMRE